MRKIKLSIDSVGTVDIRRRVEREKMAEIQSDSTASHILFGQRSRSDFMLPDPVYTGPS